MSPLDQGSNERKTEAHLKFNPSMVPDVLPEDFEKLGISHGDLEKLFTRYVNSIDAEEIDPSDTDALHKQSEIILLVDQIFEPYRDTASTDIGISTQHQGSFKLADGRVVSIFDSIDRQFFSVLPLIRITTDGDLSINYEKLKHPLRYVVRYEQQNIDEQSEEYSLQTMVLTSKECFEEMASKISIIGRYLNSSLKNPNTDIYDLPTSSYLFDNFMSCTAQRLAARSRSLPEGQSFQMSDILDARRMSPNFFAVTVKVDHLNQSSGKSEVLSSHKETHVHYAGIDPLGFVFTRWVNEHKVDVEDHRRAA